MKIQEMFAASRHHQESKKGVRWRTFMGKHKTINHYFSWTDRQCAVE
jgi:hypothetical protein